MKHNFNKFMRPLRCFICLALVFSFSELMARHVLVSDTILIESETKSIMIPLPEPAPVEDRTQEEDIEEVEQISERLRRELDAYVREMQSRDFISDNVVPEVEIFIFEEDGVPALKVTYGYTVLSDTLTYETDDFGLGKYHISDSHAVMVTLALMRNSIEEHLSRYITPEKEVTINIHGSADALPIRGTIPYPGEFSDPVREYCYIDGRQRLMYVSTTSGITDNYTLAFLRSVAVRDYIRRHIEILRRAHVLYNHYAGVSSYIGGEFRRVTIEMIIHDVFSDVEPK